MQETTEMLAGGSDLTRDLGSGDGHGYDLPLEAGQFVRIVVEQQGIDVAVEFLDPGGTSRISVDSPIGRRGAETLVAVAASSGTHRLEVRAAEPLAPDGRFRPPGGSYRLRVAEIRQASSADRDWAAAERSFSQGEEKRREDFGESKQRAAELYREALCGFEAQGRAVRQADCRFRLGLIHLDADRFKEALEAFEAALAGYRAAGSNHRETAFVLNHVGRACQSLGQEERAFRHFEEALAAAREIEPPAEEAAAAAYNNLGNLHRRRGDLEQALSGLETAVEIYRKLVQPALEAPVLINLAYVFLQQGKLDEASDQLRRALEILAVYEKPSLEALAGARLGEVEARQGRLPEAIASLERALELLHRRLGSSRSVVATLIRLGTARLKNAEHALAERTYEEALALSRESGGAYEGILHLNLGRLHLPDGDDWPGAPRTALEHFEAAATLLDGSSRQIRASNFYGAARALHDLEEFDDARSRLDEGLALVEALRTETGGEDLRVAFFATKQHYYDLYVDVLMHLHQQAPAKGLDAAAFEANERRRGRGLLDLLGESADGLREGVDAELLAREERAQQKLNALELRRYGQSRRDSAAPQAVADLEKAIRETRHELDRTRERIRRAGSRFARLSPEPRGLREIQTELLDRHSLLLAYSLGEERSFLWRISREGLTSHVLPGRVEIERRVEDARKLLTSFRSEVGERRDRALAELGAFLLAPVAADLGRHRLLIVATGKLLYLPFAALAEPGTGEPLIQRHEIVYLPSASIVLTLREELGGREPAPRPIAVFADPVFALDGQEPSEGERSPRGDLRRAAEDVDIGRDLPALPRTRQEAAEIRKLFGDEALEAVGFDASKERVLRGDLADFQILHFATHGILNRRHPELSGLALTLVGEDGRPRDGFLRLHELYDLRLNAELVVLSACQTGLGRQVRGEGMLGLTRGFMYAGVPRLVVSLWKVSDRGTAELMRRFYWALTDGAASPGMALRAAQLSMLEEERWSHPHYWAAFELQGEWRRPGGADGGIETSAAGVEVEEEPDVDLPVPIPPFCEAYPDAWTRKICHVLHRLRMVPRRTADRTRGGGPARVAEESEDDGAPSDAVYFNGVDAVTGRFVQPPLSEQRLATKILGSRRDWAEEHDLKWSHEQFQFRGPDRRPMPDVDPKNLASSGWGIIFPESDAWQPVRDALFPLLSHRRRQAAVKKKKYYRELEYRPGDTKQKFFKRYEVEPGPAHPEQLPYYLLIVGDPDTIPYRFQYLLDMQYAVGRLHFDHLEDYARYASSVVDAEQGIFDVRPEAAFFPAWHEGDPATRRTFEGLIQPLAAKLAEDREDLPVRVIEPGRKESLRRLVGGPETPALLFTSAHGLRVPSGHPRQKTHQGALVCSDWTGGPVDDEHCFAAVDIGDDARLQGLIAVFFGCFSAGTPRRDNFPLEAFRNPNLAPEAMTAPLVQRLLAHPGGGALAVLGHVDRAWTRSFSSTAGGMGYLHFEALLDLLLQGHPIGSAMDYMNERFAELSTELTDLLDQRKEPLVPGGPPEVDDPGHLSKLWRANNDARNFVVLGDPAVRLATVSRTDAAGESGIRAGGGSRRRRDLALERLREREPVQVTVPPAQARRAQRDRGTPS